MIFTKVGNYDHTVDHIIDNQYDKSKNFLENRGAWKYKDVEPSDGHLSFSKIVSTIILIFMLLILCIGE